MDLYRIKKQDVNAASKALAEAFFEDGLVCRICPEVDIRTVSVLPVFHFSTGFAAKNGEVWSVSENMEGVALWLYSWKLGCPPWRWLALGGLDIRRNLSPAGYRELTRVSDRIDRARESVAPRKFLYLSCLGVRSEFRRQGLATALVADRVQKAASTGLPTMVETNTPEALEFYKLVGFKVKTSFRAADMDYYVLEYKG
jgi:ribosomal protein S18 acetylase RimI-like enzyme